MNKFCKRILACLVFSISLSFSNAQWVTIPDANFVTYLQTTFPTCMNGNLMDTTCSGIVNAFTVDCSSKNIANLTGIRYFDNLRNLYCNNNQLTSLTVLPVSVNSLFCNNNQLTSLPVLPASLTDFYCNNNQLTTLPALPNSLQFLVCANNQLTSLPVLPASLYLLSCINNQLSSLPALSTSLNTLYCNSNLLTSLPSLPPSLNGLDCDNNQLTSLPSLPAALNYLNCYNNQLTSLPVLPSSLAFLYCYNNQISCLPTLPPSLNTLFGQNAGYSCLPNIPSTLTTISGPSTICIQNQAVITPAGPVNICAGGYATLNANTATGLIYQWKKNGVNIAGATYSTYYAIVSGSYTVLETSSAGCVGTASAAVVVTINSSPTATIAPGGNVNLCSSSSTLQANTGTGLTYQWKKNNVNISGATSSNYTVTASATYTVVITNSCGSSTSAGTVVTLSTAIPATPAGISATGGNTKMCPGDSKVYSISTVTGATSYTWTPPVGATITSGQGTKTVTVSYNAGFTVSDTIRVIAVNACGSSAQRKLKITRNTPSTPAAITGSAFGVCNLSNVPYSITNVAGMTYSWSFNVGTASVAGGQGTNSITANFNSGYTTGTLSVSANNACGTSANRTLSIKAVPATPASITGATTVCANQQGVPYSISPIASAINYTWSGPTGSHVSDGTTTSTGTNLITTATNVMVNFGSTAGKINARANNACGSGSYKNITVTFTCREIGEMNSDEESDVVIQPNPSSGLFEMMIPSAQNKNAEVEIYSPDGRLIKKQTTETNNPFTIDLIQQANGVYFVHALVDGNTISKKIVKQ